MRYIIFSLLGVLASTAYAPLVFAYDSWDVSIDYYTSAGSPSFDVTVTGTGIWCIFKADGTFYDANNGSGTRNVPPDTDGFDFHIVFDSVDGGCSAGNYTAALASPSFQYDWCIGYDDPCDVPETPTVGTTTNLFIGPIAPKFEELTGFSLYGVSDSASSSIKHVVGAMWGFFDDLWPYILGFSVVAGAISIGKRGIHQIA